MKFVLVFSGHITPDDTPRLCTRARSLLEQAAEADEVICDVNGVIDPDASVIDALARLQLSARRLGHTVRVRHACKELQELLTLSGLTDVVPLYSELPLETSGETEEGEQPRSVKEEGDPRDLSM